jgi:hypothetical protein
MKVTAAVRVGGGGKVVGTSVVTILANLVYCTLCLLLVILN